MARKNETSEKEEIATLEGSVEGIIFFNEENGYTILDMCLEKGEIVTAVGIMPYVGEGETLKVYGKWVHNPKYGRQFSVSSYEKVNNKCGLWQMS